MSKGIRADREIDYKAPENDSARFSHERYAHVFENRNARVWGSDRLYIRMKLAKPMNAR